MIVFLFYQRNWFISFFDSQNRIYGYTVRKSKKENSQGLTDKYIVIVLLIIENNLIKKQYGFVSSVIFGVIYAF